MFHHQEKKNYFWILLLFVSLGIFFGIGYFGYRLASNLTPEKILNSPLVQKNLTESDKEVFNSIPKLLGFTKPITYLVLFLNNTEMRPGGGFIGVYGVIQVDKGKVEVLKVDGTENLDRNTPSAWKPVPPKVLSAHLGVDRWYFRDSNWSPDFVLSSEKALELYKGEGGASADQINAVVGFTPTVIERILKITGPVTVDGIEFNSENFTKELEYEVEYGYEDKGVSFQERKKILAPTLLLEVMNAVKKSLLNAQNLQTYANLVYELGSEKHLMVYFQDAEMQKEINKRNWDGEIESTTGDYLMWVDANLAALKTDHAIKRNLTYSITPQKNGRLLAKVEMNYKNTGTFDWRTTRYRTYARVYAPLGSEFVSVDGSMKWDRSNEKGVVDQGEEKGKKWFGTFISIEPGQQKKLTFSYLLPENLTEKIKNEGYDLFAQKQLGMTGYPLTLDINFDKNIMSAQPAENKEKWGDKNYYLITDLLLDREIKVRF